MLFSVCAVWLSALPLLQDGRATLDEDPSAKIDFAKATRLDLSRCLLDFEAAVRAFDAREPAGAAKDETSVRIARVFDAATLSFFLGDGTRALHSMRRLEESLRETDAAARLAHSLCVRFEPAVGVVSQAAWPALTWTPFYSADMLQSAQEFEFVLVGPAPATSVVARLKLSGEKLGTAGAAAWSNAQAPVPGSYELRLGAKHLCALNVLGKAPSQLQHDFLVRWKAIAPPPTLAAAHFCAGERAKLLVDAPNPARSAEFMADPGLLAAQLEKEISALEKSKNPYRQRPGDLWRSMPRKQSGLAYRMYAPKAACGDEPHPLVIALHGAGGDENMFFDAYDLGRLRDLAEQHGFLLASPVNAFLGSGGQRAMLELIDLLSSDYAVDPARIYVLGHSMGAGAAAGLAGPLHDRLAGVVCLAGGFFSKAAKCAPILAIAADEDGIVGWRGIESSASKAREGGARIEFRRLPHLGHLTMVGPSLPAAVEWMLARKLER